MNIYLEIFICIEDIIVVNKVKQSICQGLVINQYRQSRSTCILASTVRQWHLYLALESCSALHYVHDINESLAESCNAFIGRHIVEIY